MPERRLPPWEEIQYFNSPLQTDITNVPVNGQIVGANPQRVVLYISGRAGLQAFISTQQSASQPVGLALPTNTSYVAFYEKDDATLCTSAWYNTAASAASFSVFEVILRQWPEDNPL